MSEKSEPSIMPFQQQPSKEISINLNSHVSNKHRPVVTDPVKPHKNDKTTEPMIDDLSSSQS